MTTAILSSMKTAGPAWALVSTVIGGYQDATTGWKKEMMRFLKLWGRIMQTTRALWWLIQLWAKAGHWSQAALSAKRQREWRTGQDRRAVLCLTFQLKWRLRGWMFRGTCANSCTDPGVLQQLYWSTMADFTVDRVWHGNWKNCPWLENLEGKPNYDDCERLHGLQGWVEKRYFKILQYFTSTHCIDIVMAGRTTTEGKSARRCSLRSTDMFSSYAIKEPFSWKITFHGTFLKRIGP